MDTITNLLSTQTVESIILLIIIILVAGKFIWEVLSFFYEKLQKYFNFKSREDKRCEKIIEKMEELKTDIKGVHDKVDGLTDRVSVLEEDSRLNKERFLQEARATIIDKHHYFCYRVKAIDDISLQYLESLLIDYEKEGGDGYIHNLMEDIRKLPSLEAQQLSEFPFEL